MEKCSLYPNNIEIDVLRRLEAVLFVASDGATVEALAAAVGVDQDQVLEGLRLLADRYEKHGHGIELIFLGGAWFLCTVLEVADAVERFTEVHERERVRLSKAALETLAVVAYNQPTTRSDIEEIRGVRCDRVIETLLGHGLIRIAGRKRGTGSPLLYRTTETFLRTFDLGAISDLPTIAEIDELHHEEEKGLCEA